MRDNPGDFKPGNITGITGRWKPGQSGNPKGRPLARPFKDALERQLAQLALSKGIEPERGHDVLAAALLAKGMNGDVAAIKEAMDRIDGKVPNPIVGSDEGPPVTAFAWISSSDPLPAPDERRDNDGSNKPSALASAGDTDSKLKE